MPKPAINNAPMFKTIVEKTEAAREVAKEEIAALKKDLTTLDRILSGRKKPGEFTIDDVLHGALEIYRTGSIVLENESLLQEMDEAVELSLAEDFLQTNGAQLLTEPEGWHWISPRGKMFFLGPQEEPSKAVTKLKRHLPKTPKAPAKKAEPSDQA